MRKKTDSSFTICYKKTITLVIKYYLEKTKNEKRKREKKAHA